MGSRKSRWMSKLSFANHRSSPSPSPTTAPPMEFVCPISGGLMADPVIVPTGQTFERSCIQACIDLRLAPPPLASPPSFLIPNVALKAAILHFCDSSAAPKPLPLSPAAAQDLVRRRFDPDDQMTPPTPPPFTPAKIPSFYSSSSSSSSEIETLTLNRSATSWGPSRTNLSNSISDNSTTPAKNPSFRSSSSSEMERFETIPTKNPSFGSSEIMEDPLGSEILSMLEDPQISEQESALESLRRFTRESPDRRVSLCSPRLLFALRHLLLSRYSSLSSSAAAAVVNLSLEPSNKVPIVRSGAVPALVDLLKSGQQEARGHAAGAIFSLALDDGNKAAIGVLGAIPPLLHIFQESNNRDAGMALYHLTLMGANRAKLARVPGAAAALMRAAGGGEARLAMMVVGNLAGSKEGRAALMDGGAVRGIVEMMRTEEEYCVAALYGMRGGGMRFRGLARAAGAEEELERVAKGRNDASEVRREMARRTLMSIRGEEDYDAGGEAASVVSEGLVSFRRGRRDFGTVSTANSAEF